jgi:RNA polymerase sigma-70 factor (ECF subfamily)
VATGVMFEMPRSPLVVARAAGERTPAADTRAYSEEREAIAACLAGDRDAFGLLVERHQRGVYRLCYRYLNNHEDASDLAQETFIKAYRALGRFRGESSFATWLFRIAVNACLNFRAARGREAEELPEALADTGPSVAERLVFRQQANRVQEAVGRLPPKQRATLILKVYHEMSHEQVAGVLGTTVGTVKANLFHALGNLRKLLGAPGRG